MIHFHFNLTELRKAVCVGAAIGLWTILYPELVFQEGICSVVDEEGEPVEEISTGEKISEVFFSMDRQNLRIKSRIWEEIKKWTKKSD